ncbi:MAG: hypothetical protein K6T16_01835 [Candidatus Pacearchaeota archaeon]|nr:hypothetical protein [Candidatus Pacearchaeota archaeon]
MSLGNLVSILSLFAQANQPIVYELPLPKGKLWDISREYGVKEQVISLDADSTQDIIYRRINDEGEATIIDFRKDGKVDYVIITDGKKNEIRTYKPNSKNQSDAEGIKVAEKSLKNIMEFIQGYLRKK